MARASAFDVHFRLRPTLGEARDGDSLAFRRGLDLERGAPNRPTPCLGRRGLWELVRPDRPQPLQRHAAGIDEERLERVVTALERI